MTPRPGKRRSRAIAVVVAATTLLPVPSKAACPTPAADGAMVVGDALVIRKGLAVNPDGAAGSYTPGDHGFTYIANGVNLRGGQGWLSCSKVHAAQCRAAWFKAEAGGFGPGTPEFCVFAMEVEPLTPGAGLVSCQGGGRSIAGGGKGRPRAGPPTPAVGGGTVRPYLSTTSLKHTRDGKAVYVDSAAVPGLVAPRARGSLVGAVAWVRWNGRSSFAIVNDTGPAFGEASLALHQLLRYGAVGPAQPLGPIPRELRCGPEEQALRAPFESRPDISGDRCRPGHRPAGPSDIRGYLGIPDGVEMVILPRVKPPMKGAHLVTEEISPVRLEALAAAAGYTPERLAAVAACQVK